MPSELIGYANKFSVSPGEGIRFMVSTDERQYEVNMVRLIHGDENPAGPGFKENLVQTSVNGNYAGSKQVICTGSYLLLEDSPCLRGLGSLTVQSWIFPTTPGRGRLQGLLSKWSHDLNAGFVFAIEPEGDLALWIGCARGRVQKVRTEQPLRASQWYFVAASYDCESGRASLYQWSVPNLPLDPSSTQVETMLAKGGISDTAAPLLIAAGYRKETGIGNSNVCALYNGKIDGPKLFRRALGSHEVTSLAQGVSAQDLVGPDVVAAWDFSAEMASSRILDRSSSELHGVAVNCPARAVTGHNWTGSSCDFKQVPHEYSAIHFHEDDLEDAAWKADFEWTIPDDLQSGVYAARLRAGNLEDHIPFFVRPKKGTVTAPIAYLIPTLTYMAYANERLQFNIDLGQPGVIGRPIQPDPRDVYLSKHPELGLSLYDLHSDGSGSLYSSRLRPILNIRPKYRMWLLGAPRNLAGDLYLIDWLEEKQFAYDVLTDEDLHAEGYELLARYKVVMTGTHPEYYTHFMLTALEQYLQAGGRLMYLGGNGFYWVTTVNPQRPYLIELRRGLAATGPFKSAVGEGYHSTTGEMGGIWRHRGKPPNRLVGVGFGAMGWDTTSYGYTRRPGSLDSRVQFIFEGIGEDEVIGNFGLVMDGAVGDELDHLDYDLGAPPHALLLASSGEHSGYYLPVLEDLTQITPTLARGSHPNVRADMVYFETQNRGAVFSVGSISWCGSLSHNHYQNNVSRITENVLREFLSAVQGGPQDASHHGDGL